MIRIAVQGEDYDVAATTFVRANQLAASSCERLAHDLGGYGAMAGDDATSTEFGEAYDLASREALGAHIDLAYSFATLARLTDRSMTNHHDADAASATGRASPVTPERSSSLDDLEGVTARTPPSSIGGDGGDLPELWDLVVDHLQGFAWPDADTDRLRAAAATWRRAATHLRMLPDLCRSGSAVLERQRSPEIPAALDSIADLERGVDDLARVHDDLARACDDYADDVEEHRDTVKGILKDLAIEAGVSIAIGIALGFFTFGGGAAVGTAVAATRIAVAAHRILTTLRALKSAAKLGAVARMTAAVDDVRPLRTLLARFRRAGHVDDAAGVRKADDLAGWRHLPRQIEYTWDRVVHYKRGGPKTPMEHIKEGHWPDSTLPGKGHFSEGVTEQMVMDYVDEAVRRGKVDAEDLAQVDCDLGRVIGTDIDGQATSKIRIYIRDGVVRTAFPI